jgi:hypothetical protein
LPQSKWGNFVWIGPAELTAGAEFIVGSVKEGASALGGVIASKVGGIKPNLIGAEGARRVGAELGFEIRQIDLPGSGRRYDGYDPVTGSYLEIKSTRRGTIYPNDSIRSQIEIDKSQNVKWVFVNGEPSLSLIILLQNNNIPFMVWFE